MTALQRWRVLAPYVLWTALTDDGGIRHVLANRNYWPVLEFSPGGPVRPADPYEWVKGIKGAFYLFHDGSAPWARRRPNVETIQRLDAVLDLIGCPPLPPMPRGSDMFWPNHIPRINPWAQRLDGIWRPRPEPSGPSHTLH
jgi:hypothetical protein